MLAVLWAAFGSGVLNKKDMKHTDVRVGNIINFFDDDTWFKIKSIDSDGLGFEVSNYIEDTWIECKRFDGVILTPEILIKLGFKQIDYYYQYKIKEDELEFFNLDVERDGYFCLTICGYYFTIKHLHQLQNLYFSLTGKELTMEV